MVTWEEVEAARARMIAGRKEQGLPVGFTDPAALAPIGEALNAVDLEADDA